MIRYPPPPFAPSAFYRVVEALGAKMILWVSPLLKNTSNSLASSGDFLDILLLRDRIN